MTREAPLRCSFHDLAAGPDGRCARCRRADPPVTMGGDPPYPPAQPAQAGGGGIVLAGLVALSLLAGGAIVYRGGRGLLALLTDESGEIAPDEARAGRVRLFTAPWCPHCDRAKQWLTAQHVAFDEIDLEKSPTARREHRRLSPRGSIPTLDANGEVVVGFDSDAYRAAIKRGAHKGR